jgi:hypothetical protein
MGAVVAAAPEPISGGLPETMPRIPREIDIDEARLGRQGGFDALVE